jgi:CMP-2-keto-3-deoxyoctulosonic acid synthetase
MESRATYPLPVALHKCKASVKRHIAIYSYEAFPFPSLLGKILVSTSALIAYLRKCKASVKQHITIYSYDAFPFPSLLGKILISTSALITIHISSSRPVLN